MDERGKNYCINGDEAISNEIVRLTRGQLGTAIRKILFHGIRTSNRIVSSFVSHPWPFIGRKYFNLLARSVKLISILNFF